MARLSCGKQILEWISLTAILTLLWEKLNLGKLKIQVTSSVVPVSAGTDHFFCLELQDAGGTHCFCLKSSMKLAKLHFGMSPKPKTIPSLIFKKSCMFSGL